MKKKFAIDRRNGKLLGVCAGIANATGWDVTLVRIGLVLVTLAGLFPWTPIAYGLTAWLAKPARAAAEERGYSLPRTSTYDLKHSMTEIDRRMAEVETYGTSPNTHLAREIESLR